MLLDLFTRKPFLKIVDMNDVLINPTVLGYLRAMTLHGDSGMAKTLNAFQAMQRKVDAKAIIAYANSGEPIGWALLSRETTSQIVEFNPEMGYYFQVYVRQEHRRKGIGTAILAKARTLVKDKPLCVACWNDTSYAFYEKNEDKKVVDIY